MIIELKETNLTLSSAMKEYVGKKFQFLKRFAKRYEDKEEIHVFVEIAKTTKHHRKGNIFYAEVTMKLPKGVIRAEATNIDVKTALDELKDLVKNECRQYKEKHIMEPRKNVQKG